MNDLHEGILSEFVEASYLGQTTWLDWLGIEAEHIYVHIAKERFSTGAKSPEATKAWKKRNAVYVAATNRRWRQDNREKVSQYSRNYRKKQKEKRAA
jgi:hypothetical protein